MTRSSGCNDRLVDLTHACKRDRAACRSPLGGPPLRLKLRALNAPAPRKKSSARFRLARVRAQTFEQGAVWAKRRVILGGDRVYPAAAAGVRCA